MRIEVVYALPDEQVLLTVELSAGATVRHAIETSGILARHPRIDLASDAVGVFGKIAKLDDPLRDGDRVEIYRPLTMDPKDARRKRALKRQPG